MLIFGRQRTLFIYIYIYIYIYVYIYIYFLNALLNVYQQGYVVCNLFFLIFFIFYCVYHLHRKKNKTKK